MKVYSLDRIKQGVSLGDFKYNWGKDYYTENRLKVNVCALDWGIVVSTLYVLI